MNVKECWEALPRKQKTDLIWSWAPITSVPFYSQACSILCSETTKGVHVSWQLVSLNRRDAFLSVARIVVVSSRAHRYVQGMDIDDINREKATFRIMNYSHSKLANLLFAYELARRIPPEHNVTVNACHPGVVATDLGRHLVTEDSNILLRFFSKCFSSFFKTSAQGITYLNLKGRSFVCIRGSDANLLGIESRGRKSDWKVLFRFQSP